MRTINKWRYLYYWTKAEKALDEGNEDKYRKYRDKLKIIQLLTIRKGWGLFIGLFFLFFAKITYSFMRETLHI